MRYLIRDIRRLIHWINQKRRARRCRGCNDPSPHTCHLTRAGRRRYARGA